MCDKSVDKELIWKRIKDATNAVNFGNYALQNSIGGANIKKNIDSVRLESISNFSTNLQQ